MIDEAKRDWQSPGSPGAGIRPTAFRYAEAFLSCHSHTLALWNHQQCRGWQLYAGATGKRRWLAGAGPESVGWIPAKAIKWAEGILTKG